MLGTTAFVSVCALTACGSLHGPSSSTRVTVTTTPLPPASAGEAALAQDLPAVATAVKAASASLTTIQANEATGTSYSPSQVTVVMAPVTGALTTSIQGLTAAIPTLPGNTVAPARLLSNTLSTSLEQFRTYSLPDVSDVGAAMTEAETKEEIALYQSTLSSLGGLDISSDAQFLSEMGKDVKL